MQTSLVVLNDERGTDVKKKMTEKLTALGIFVIENQDLFYISRSEFEYIGHDHLGAMTDDNLNLVAIALVKMCYDRKKTEVGCLVVSYCKSIEGRERFRVSCAV